MGNGKQRWRKVVSVLKRFTTPRTRELERELSDVRNEFRELGLRASTLAREENNVRTGLEKAQQHIESIHQELGSAYKQRDLLTGELQEQLISLKAQLGQAQGRYDELMNRLSARDQQIDTLESGLQARLSAEEELRDIIGHLQQQLTETDRSYALATETNRNLTAELESLRAAAQDIRNTQAEQFTDVRRRLDDTESVNAALNSAWDDQKQLAQTIQAQLTSVAADLNPLQTVQSELQTHQAENDRQLEMLTSAAEARRVLERELVADMRSLEKRTEGTEGNNRVIRDQHQTLAVELESDRRKLAELELKLGDIEAEHAITHDRIKQLQDSLADTASSDRDTRQQLTSLETDAKNRETQLSKVEESLARLQIEQEALLNGQSSIADTLRKNRQWTLTAVAVALLLGALAGAALFRHGAADSPESAALIDEPVEPAPPQDLSDTKPAPQEPASTPARAVDSAAFETHARSPAAESPDATEAPPSSREPALGISAVDEPKTYNSKNLGHETDSQSTVPPIADHNDHSQPALSKAQVSTQSRRPLTPVEALATVQAFDNEKFFEDNARKEGVISLPSGLQYKVLKQGHGKSPGPSDLVLLHYRGRLPDGRVFNDSHTRNAPAAYRVDELIPGWRQALRGMREGAKWEIYIPPQLGHAAGVEGTAGFLPLIYELELVAVSRLGAS